MMKNFNSQKNQPKATFKKRNTPSLEERTLGRFERDNESLTTIYIGNLSYKKDQDGIKKLFTKYGKVSFVRLMIDKKTNLKKGFAFVQMPNKKDALKAISELNGKVEDGRTLKCSIAIDSPKKEKGPKFIDKVAAEKDDETLFERPKRRRDKKGLNVLFANTGRLN